VVPEKSLGSGKCSPTLVLLLLLSATKGIVVFLSRQIRKRMDMEQVGFAELEELERAIAAAEADPPPETPAAPTNAPKMDEDEELDEDAALLAALEEVA